MKIGFLGLLTIVFITLKLTNYVDWSWLWVLSPAWIGFILWLLAVVIIVIAHATETPSQRYIRLLKERNKV